MAISFFEAPAGVGKTTFLAHEANVHNAVHHFCELTPGDEGVLAGILNLASQLVRAWLLSDEVGLVRAAVIGPEYLQKLLKRAATKRDAIRPNDRIVIMIDSLELAGCFRDRNVLGLPKHLAKGVYIVASQRPVNVNLAVSPRKIISIDPEDSSNLEDLRGYVRGITAKGALARILRAQDCNVEEFVETLLSKARGSWVYVEFVLNDIEAGRRSPLTVDQLPPSLWRYYAEFFSTWKKHNPNEWTSTGLKLLASLAAFQSDMELNDLIAIVGLSDLRLATRILSEDWAAFIQRSPILNRFRVYHASTQDFASGSFDASEGLTNQERLFADSISQATVSAHAVIANWFLQAWGGTEYGLPGLMEPQLSRADAYGIRYVPFHLAKGQEYSTLHVLLNVIKGASNIWYEAMLKQDDLNGFLLHLNLAWNTASDAARSVVEPDTKIWALIVRYPLTSSSIASLATNVPPPLVSSLLTSGLWTINRALTYAERSQDGEPRARAYMYLLRATEGRTHSACLRSMIHALANVNGSPPGVFQRRLWIELFENHSDALSSEDYAECL